jgi:hypothetical protein
VCGGGAVTAILRDFALLLLVLWTLLVGLPLVLMR